MARASRHSKSTAASPSSALGIKTKIALSLLLFWHIWAVLAEPMRFQTLASNGPSPITNALYQPVGPYAEFMYLTHGYAFFAPQPGPSHLMEVTIKQGDQVQTRRYPDLKLDQPRLFYHRHFMLSEFLNNLYRPLPPRDLVLTETERRGVEAEQRLYRTVRNSMLHHLSVAHGGAEITLDRVEHRMPGLPEFFEEKIHLDHPRLYQVLREDASTPPLGLPPPAFLYPKN